jgi:hypothetical protein
MNDCRQDRIGFPYTAFYHRENCHDNAEKDRICKNGKNPFGKLPFCRQKVDNVLPNQRQDEACVKLQLQIRQHVFGVKQESNLKEHPHSPYYIGGFFAIFQIRGIDTCTDVRQQQKDKFYNGNRHTASLLFFTLKIPKGFFDFTVFSSGNGNSNIVIQMHL